MYNRFSNAFIPDNILVDYFVREYMVHGNFDIQRISLNAHPVVIPVYSSPLYSANEDLGDYLSRPMTTRNLERQRLHLQYSRFLLEDMRNPQEIMSDVCQRMIMMLDDTCCIKEETQVIETTQDKIFEKLIEENMEGATFIVLGARFKEVLAQAMLNHLGMTPFNMQDRGIMIQGTKCIISNGIPEDEAFLFTDPKILVSKMQPVQDMSSDSLYFYLHYYFSNRRAVKLKMLPYDGLVDLSYRMREMNDRELTEAVKDVFGDHVDFRIDDDIRESDDIIRNLMSIVKGD